MNANTPSPDDEKSVGIIRRLQRYFLAGIIVTAPIAITLYMTWAILRFIDLKTSGLFPEEYRIAVPGIGIVLAISFFIIMGWLAKNFFGRAFLRVSEYLLGKMPVIRTLYGALKQVFETIMGGQAKAFREVVLIEFPRKGIWGIGFITGATEGEVQRLTDEQLVNVYYPTTPNPTSGFLLFIPKKDLIFLEMTVDEAIKMIISGGIITPPDHATATNNHPEPVMQQ